MCLGEKVMGLESRLTIWVHRQGVANSGDDDGLVAIREYGSL